MVKLSRPEGIRPTTGRVIKALYDILGSRVESMAGWQCLELFAGSGAVGLKALELGAELLVAVDLDQNSLNAIQKNAKQQKCTDKVKIVRLDCNLENLPKIVGKFDLIFLDPPFKLDPAELVTLLNALEPLAKPDAWLILEFSARQRGKLEAPRGFRAAEERVYGDVGLWFWRAGSTL